MKRFTIAIGFFLTIFLCECYAFDDGDFQYWNTESVSFKVGDDWQAQLDEEFRYGDDGGDFYRQHSDLGFTYSGFAKWLDVGINYRHIFQKKDDKWARECRPHLNITLKGKLCDWALRCRGRFEYRDTQNSNDGWRYRDKFTVKLPFKFSRLEIQPYIADEIFVDFDERELNRNRLYAGFSMKLFKKLKAEIFYLWQRSKKDDEWIDVNILGTKLKFSF